MRPISPASLAPGRGYSNGLLAPPGRMLFVAGQIAWDADARIVSDDFATQFAKALENVVAVVREAGGEPKDVGQLTIYVKDKQSYLGAVAAVGAAYRAHMGKHFPAMALVEVKDLLDPGAQVEIQATAVIP
ncbi:MAG: RidA family protein [Myxococcales bacterium]|nr:RidA family protein [Myxococcales bacterium]